MPIKVGVIGAGAIAAALIVECQSKGWEIVCTARRNSYTRWGREFQRSGMSNDDLVRELLAAEPTIMFIAISTQDSGEAARDFIKRFGQQGMLQVTCEKGAWANYPKEIKSFSKRMGYSTVVAGWSGVLQYLQNAHPNHHKTRFELVLNASLGCFFSELARGKTSEEASTVTEKLGYLEPLREGATNDPLSRINGEISFDVPRKVCALYNITLARGRYLVPLMFKPPVLSAEELEDMLPKKKRRRYSYVVSFSNHGRPPEPEFGKRIVRGGFATDIDGWSIDGSFVGSSTGQDVIWPPFGAYNGVRLTIDDQEPRILLGLGAGPRSIALGMIDDAMKLLGSH